MFNGAVNEKIISENPMKLVEKPKSCKRQPKVRALTLEEQSEFVRLLATEDIPYSAEMLLSLYTGMRMGEVLALEEYLANLGLSVNGIEQNQIAQK